VADADEALRERVIEITHEYWATRESGMTERIAVAQLIMALARVERDNAEPPYSFWHGYFRGKGRSLRRAARELRGLDRDTPERTLTP